MASETPPSWLVESDLWQVTSGGFFLQGRSGQLRGVPQRTRIRVAAWRYIPWMVFAETAPPRPPVLVGQVGMWSEVRVGQEERPLEPEM